MSTPHNSAQRGDFAKTVLMPGDPLRAKFVAENYLENARLVNSVRCAYGYTGFYRGCPVSVMASGMGMPSIGIYAHELFGFYGAENIIRIGTAGGMREEVRVRDLVFGMGACTNSNFAAHFGLRGTFAPIASYPLLTAAVEEAEKLGARCHVGNLFSTDVFYSEDAEEANAGWRRMGVLAVEMEAAALYMTAARMGKRALAVCTVSDHLITHESCTPEEREKTFTVMMEAALNTAVRIS